MRKPSLRLLAGPLSLTLGLALAACGGMPSNPTVYSTHQAVVERSTMVLDVTTSSDGLPIAEQQRIAAWFEAINLGYGDRVSIDDPTFSPQTRSAVARLSGRYGLLVADGSPIVAGDLAPGQARVVIARSNARVPGCPDWSETSDATLLNGLSANYGCATNANMAAMMANPEDLIMGQKGSPDTYITTSTRSINAYQQQVGSVAGGTSGGN